MENVRAGLLEMSEAKQQTLNGHKEVQSKAVIAPYLSVQKKDFENTEDAAELDMVGGAFTTNSSKDLGRVWGIVWSQVFLEHSGSFSQGGAKVLSKVRRFPFISEWGGEQIMMNYTIFSKVVSRLAAAASPGTLEMLNSWVPTQTYWIKNQPTHLCFNMPWGDSDAP